jgi:hypothetical protein
MFSQLMMPAQNLWWAQPPPLSANSFGGMGGPFMGQGLGHGMRRPALHPSISYEDLLRLMAQMYGERR